MLEISHLLSRNFTFIRVDLYTNDETIYVGELTSCPGGELIGLFHLGVRKIFRKLCLATRPNPGSLKFGAKSDIVVRSSRVIER